uniref:Uncharacterized protein n=1 Tax=Rhizophora mucronata TaxID=61149 RepID=A0A2P2PRM0_RHIMU
MTLASILLGSGHPKVSKQSILCSELHREHLCVEFN